MSDHTSGRITRRTRPEPVRCRTRRAAAGRGAVPCGARSRRNARAAALERHTDGDHAGHPVELLRDAQRGDPATARPEQDERHAGICRRDGLGGQSHIVDESARLDTAQEIEERLLRQRAAGLPRPAGSTRTAR